jgi:hypothetical protein
MAAVAADHRSGRATAKPAPPIIDPAARPRNRYRLKPWDHGSRLRWHRFAGVAGAPPSVRRGGDEGIGKFG